MSTFPQDLRYTHDHEWLQAKGAKVYVVQENLDARGIARARCVADAEAIARAEVVDGPLRRHRAGMAGGGLGAAARAALSHAPALSPWYQCPVEAACLGDEAGVIGAGLVALTAAG